MPQNTAARADDWLARSLAEKAPAELESAPSESVLPDHSADSSPTADAAKNDRPVVYQEIDKPRSRVRGVLAGIFTFLFVFGFMGASFYQTYTLRGELEQLKAQQQELEAQIEEAKTQALLGKIDRSYYGSDKYREDMARNRFRLIYPGEYLVQIE